MGGDESIFNLLEEEYNSHGQLVGKGYCKGLTKRELFAVMAMMGTLDRIIAKTTKNNPDLEPWLFENCVKAADMLLAELEKTNDRKVEA